MSSRASTPKGGVGSATKRSATSSSKRNATASEIHDRLQKTMNSFSEEDKLEFKDAVRDLKVMVGKCSTPQSPGARARAPHPPLFFFARAALVPHELCSPPMRPT
jgi:hypothetical protein